MLNIEKNLNEILRRLLKYIIHTALIAIMLIYGPCNKLSTKEVITITLSASCIFVLLDIYSPGIVVVKKNDN